jgi:hypothetical protein
MTAKQLMLPAHRAFDSDGAPEAGATAHLYLSGTLTPAVFYADSGLTVSMGSTITANAAGRFDPMPYQDAAVAFRIIIQDSEGAELDDIDPFYFGLVAGVDGVHMPVKTRTDLANIATLAANDSRYLTESGREGDFVYSTANLSANVTADVNQGIYVPPASAPTGASGAWVRKFSAAVNPNWFGILPTNTAAQNNSAWASMAATLRLTAVASHTADPTGFYRTLGVIRFPDDKTYNFSTVLDVDGGSYAVEGAGPATRYSGTTLLWNNTSSGFNIDYGNSASSGTGGTWTAFRHLRLEGGYTSGAEATRHAILSSDRIRVESCVLINWAGEGVAIAATSPAGNANSGYIALNDFVNCRTGLKLSGADANNIISFGNNYSGCREWGEWRSEFLGGVSIMPQMEVCGMSSLNDGVTVAASVVFLGGHRYYCKQTAGASTNSPSGTTASNTWWGYLNDLGTGTGVPTWVNGGVYRIGGPILTDNANATITIDNPYVEDGQPPISGVAGTCINNGHVYIAPIGLCTWERNISGDKTFDYVKIVSRLNSYGSTQSFGPITGTTDLNLFWDSPVTGTLHTWRTAGVAQGYDFCNNVSGRVVRGEVAVVLNRAGTDILSAQADGIHVTGLGAFSGALTASNLSGTNTGDGAYTIQTKILGYTATETAGDIVVKADLAAGFTIVLPTAVGNKARFTFKKIQAAGAIVIDGAGTETIDGGLTATLNNQNESITIVSDNANWMII